MRYIDADLLRKNMAELQEHENKYLQTHEVFNTIWDTPTADVVEIVRCKDCRKWQTTECPFYSEYVTVMPNKDQFCSLAERERR